LRIDPARLEAFATAHVSSVLAAVQRERWPWHGEQSVEDYALEVTLAMVESVKRAGIEAIEHYYLNAFGGALRATAAALGIEANQLDNYLGGK
jgi:hypothetical protein